MHVRRVADCKRRRRFTGPAARRRWYALHRQARFARSDFREHYHHHRPGPSAA